MEINIDILKQAIDKWGHDSQINMIEEECLELALAIHKSKRKSSSFDESIDNIIDEIADVSIIIQQAYLMFPMDKINERIEYKMERLKNRLNQ
jgi:NTP pyrophosphatase (non-canonical NTP hydrolase)